MVALNRMADGRWFARKGVPADVREEYQRLYGTKREAHLRLPAGTPKHEAKARLGEWEAEVETRIATLRAQRNGEGQPLTNLNAIALAGRWYNWFVKQHEDDPGPPKRWREAADYFVWDVLRDEAPDSYEADPSSDPHGDWEKAPEVREAVRPHVAELARTASFLASEGRALNATAYALFMDAVSDNLLPALSVLERRAKGDYSRDDTPDTFPRKKLLGAYKRCAITGCDAVEALEAAHIAPYRGDHTDHVQNGLLLRADIHSLFDLGLLSIDPRTMSVVVALHLRKTTYGQLAGSQLLLPTNLRERPSIEALANHLSWAGIIV
ncbi:HNH endonuclease signature motif containing protein [Bradyrhizobium sp. 177]|uniref:HNH endonuclease n=1 Tax=Bradyrhizobium sp. 177 TaxID=2782647 RepID=UPI001FF89CEE|nr:HNH endonuclease signature motif containing protein [Bradyrhizobium sp. 177]